MKPSHQNQSTKRSADFSPPARPTQPIPPQKPNSAIKALLLPLLALTLLPTTAPAEELPRKAPLPRYSGLWTNSPFTSRPVIETPEAPPEENPLEDYALVGVSPVAEGFRVTLINRNDPAERIVINSANPNPRHDFKVLEIDRKPGRPLSTTVRLSMGNNTGTVGFEQELLTLSPPPAAPQPQPNLPPGVFPGQDQQEQPQGARRQPRPRVVPPPANAQQQQNAQQQRAAALRARAQRAQGGNRERADRRGRR